ncbi:hypothetical protein [Agrobacterium sp. LMR679]|uniref:hypothetical protein n=1 Tax=Agrobacterium sp. LMR679 TaxID=3014335 RepID=UPI0022AF757C|nr:hypothetical protein [Agrobacterium sp. LMR679]MCZ4074053.1 hypothetical protein [Agrobacterium sp. LMR679]
MSASIEKRMAPMRSLRKKTQKTRKAPTGAFWLATKSVDVVCRESIRAILKEEVWPFMKSLLDWFFG